MRFSDLTIFILQDIRSRSMYHANSPPRRVAESRRMFARSDPTSTRFDSNEFNMLIIHKSTKDSNRIRPATHTRNDRIRQTPHFHHYLFTCFRPDHRLKLTHHRRVRVRSQRRTEQIMRIAHIRHPIADRFIDRILQRLRARSHWSHFRTEQLHAKHVRFLSRNIHHTHIHYTFESKQRRHRRRRDSMLPRARLCHNAPLPHPLHEQRLPQRVVDLMRARVRQVFALQIDLRTAQFF